MKKRYNGGTYEKVFNKKKLLKDCQADKVKGQGHQT